MSKPIPLESLTKNELLLLIKHELPETLFSDHPCECVCCGEEPIEEVERWGLKVKMYAFQCDACVAAECEHKWVTRRRSGDPTDYFYDERITYCDKCGTEQTL